MYKQLKSQFHLPRNSTCAWFRLWDSGPTCGEAWCGSHVHTDLLLGCQQVLKACCCCLAPLHLSTVPVLDGDSSLVHLVDKPTPESGFRT
jgi:hypothetical protein